MDPVLQELKNIGIIPVIAIDDAEKAVPLAKALVSGGLPAAEVTFRTAAGEAAMRAIAKEVPEMILGAGTVTTKDQVDRALDAGARFIVSPGFNPEVTRYALSKGAVMAPGTATAGEMEQAMELGLDVVKFFPAEQNGGVAKLKAFAGPYKNLYWMPTGGVNTGNMMDYLSFDKVLCCGGTWMVKKDVINAEKWDEVTAVCRDVVKTMLGFEIRHIGMNHENAEEAVRSAKLLSGFLGLELQDFDGACMVGSLFEVLKSRKRGKYGHIGINTNNVDRAIFQMKRRGVEFAEDTRESDEKGTKVIYLKDEIGGFAIHLIRK